MTKTFVDDTYLSVFLIWCPLNGADIRFSSPYTDTSLHRLVHCCMVSVYSPSLRTVLVPNYWPTTWWQRHTVIQTRSSAIADKPPDAGLTGFCDCYQRLSHLTPSLRGSPRTIRFIFGMEELEWLSYNLVKVARRSTQSFGHNTSTWQTHRWP